MNWALLGAKLARLHKSWTMWFNAVVGTAAFAVPVAADNFPMLQGYVPTTWYHYCMGALMFGNFVLRLKTSKPLQEK